MPTTTRRPTQNRKPSPLTRVRRDFNHWFGLKTEGKKLAKRQGDFRDTLLEDIEELGVEDEKGNFWLDLGTPITLVDEKDRELKFTTLKKERYLVPGQATPDPEKAEALLKKKKLWLTPAQVKTLRDIQSQNRYALISVEVDVDAVGLAYLGDLITEKEYDSVLVEQKENFRFIPSES